METTPLSAFKITGTRIDGFIGEGITEVVIPDGITEIRDESFRYTVYPAAANIKTVCIPDSVTSIGEYAFLFCEKLECVRLPANLQILRSSVFSGCKSLESIQLPKNLRTIGASALSSTKIRRIVVPAGVTYIGRGAFYCCHSLESITIPESVQTIEQQAFEGCEKLTIRTTSGSWAKSYAWLHNIPVTLITKKEMAQELLDAQVSYRKLNVFVNDDFCSEVLRRAEEKKPAEKHEQIDVIRNDDDFAKVRNKASALLDEAKRSGNASSKKIDEINALLKKMEEYASSTAVVSPITPTPEHSSVNKASNPTFAEKLRTDTKTPSQLREEARQKERNRASQVSAALDNRIANETERITNKIRSECESMAAQGKRKLKTSVSLSNSQWPSNTNDKEKLSAYKQIRSAVEQQLKKDRFPVLHVDLKKISNSTWQSTHELRFFIVW